MSAVNPLSAEFLYELYATALRQEPLCAVLARHMRKEYLPDRSFQQVQEAIAVHFKTYKTPPSYAVLAQTFHEDYDAIELIDTFREYDEGQSAEVMTDMLESYIKGVRLQSVYAEVGKLYNENKQDKAEKTLREYAEWLAGFTLKSSSMWPRLSRRVSRGTAGARRKRNARPPLVCPASTSRIWMRSMPDVTCEVS